MRFRIWSLLIVGCLALITATATPSYATTYTGSIFETITSTNSPTYSVGQTAVGSYSYISPTIDGDFGSCEYVYGSICAQVPSQNGLLFGSITIFWNGHPEIVNFADVGVFWPRTHMVVSGGQVTAFHIDGQLTSISDFDCEFIGCGVRENFLPGPPPPPHYSTNSSLVFSAPVVTTPESSSLFLLVIGLTGIIVMKVRKNPSLKSRIQS